MATEVTVIVDPDGGAGYDYTSLAAAIAGEARNLVTADEQLTIKCRCTGGTADGEVTIDGFTTDATRYVKIWTDPSESYRWCDAGRGADRRKYPSSGNYYRIEGTATSGSIISNRDDLVHLVGLAVKLTLPSGTARAVTTYLIGSTTYIDKCYILGDCTGTGGAVGYYDYSHDSYHYITNTVITGFKSQSNTTDQHFVGVSCGYGSVYVYNCTICDCGWAVWATSNSDTVDVVNCAIFNNFGDVYSTYVDLVDYNATDQSAGTHNVRWLNGSTDWDNVFTDYANGDFSLKNFTGTGKIIGMGTDNPGSGLYSDDILGNARTSTWDIGAFEYVSAGPTPIAKNLTDSWELLSDSVAVTKLPVLLSESFTSDLQDIPEATDTTTAFLSQAASTQSDLNLWSDDITLHTTAAFYIEAPDVWELLNDSVAAVVGAPNLTALFQDDLNTWNDFLTQFSLANYTFVSSDSWLTLGDSVTTYLASPNLIAAFQDAFNNWDDLLTLYTTSNYLNTFPDSWLTLNDSITIYLAEPNLTAVFQDNLNAWADSYSSLYTLGVASSDSWEALADSLLVQILTPTAVISAQFLDSLTAWADDFGLTFTAHHRVGLADVLNIPADGISTFAHLDILLMDYRPTIEDRLFVTTGGEAMYSYETFAELKAQLAARLHDTAMIYWTDAELTVLLQETFRTFSFLTWHWREQGTFNTIPGTEMYDIATELSSRLGHTLTDRNLINDIQYHFQETPTTDWPAGWGGTAMFSMDDVAHCLQKRRNKFLADTGCYLTRTVAWSGGPASGRISLTDNIIDVRRVARDNSGVMTNLWRVNEEELTAFDTSWAAPAAQDPTEYSIMATPPLTVQLSPAPLAAATLDMLTVSAGADFTPTTSATVVGVPDDMAWIVKWGAMADLLLKDGPARDPERAKYCEERYQHGVALARLATPIVQARIGTVPLTVCALSELDAYSPGWQSHTPGTPTTLATAGMNYIAVDPPPSAGVAIYLEVVQNAPVPSLDTDLIQIGREMVSTILDYAVHLAMFKVGGAEWQASQQLMEQFLLMCGNYNKRMEAASRLWKDMHSITNYEEAARRRLKESGEPRTPENWGAGRYGGKQ